MSEDSHQCLATTVSEALAAFRSGALAVCTAADRGHGGLRRFTRDADETAALAKAATSSRTAALEVARLLTEVQVAASACVDVCTVTAMVFAATMDHATVKEAKALPQPSGESAVTNATRRIFTRSLATVSTLALRVAQAAQTARIDAAGASRGDSEEKHADMATEPLQFDTWAIRQHSEGTPAANSCRGDVLIGAGAALQVSASGDRPGPAPPVIATAPVLILRCLASLGDRCRGLRQRALILMAAAETAETAETPATLGHLVAVSSLCALSLHSIVAWGFEWVITQGLVPSSLLAWDGPPLNDETTVACTTLLAQLPAVTALLGGGSHNHGEPASPATRSLLTLDVTRSPSLGCELLATVLRVLTVTALNGGGPHESAASADTFDSACAMRQLDELIGDLERGSNVRGLAPAEVESLDLALDAASCVRDHLASVLLGGLAPPTTSHFFSAHDSNDSDQDAGDAALVSLMQLAAVFTWTTCCIAGGTRSALWFRLLPPAFAGTGSFPEASGLRQLFRGTADGGAGDAARVLRTVWLQWCRC